MSQINYIRKSWHHCDKQLSTAWCTSVKLSKLGHHWFGWWPIAWSHDDVIKWKHFSRYWHFMQVIHRSPVNSPHKGQSRGALMFSLICAWINTWVNNREASDLRRYVAHYDVTVMDPKPVCELMLIYCWFVRCKQFLWNSNQNTTHFEQKNQSATIVCKVLAISSNVIKVVTNRVSPNISELYFPTVAIVH